MKRTFALLLVLLLLFPPAAADGMMFISDRDMWNLQPEENQLAAIHYENGMENLLLTVSPGTTFSGDHAVWIFPVPARPENVKIDVLKGYPRLYGENFDEDYTSTVTTAAAAQIIYATFPVSALSGAPVLFLSAYVFGMAGNIQKSGGVDIYDRVEKMGVTTEVVTATDAYALRNYLATLGMTGNENERLFLQDYIGKDYTFVVSYISDVEKFKASGRGTETYYGYGGSVNANLVGVFARFPTEKIYFPLRPTAVYGSRQVPVLLYVTGFVNPELYKGIRADTEVTYFTDDSFSTSDDLAPFFNGKTKIAPLEYTKIRITTPSDRFTEDLWIDHSPPADMAFKKAYRDLWIPVTIVAYALFSVLACLIAGTLCFRKKPADKKTLVLHGLLNLGTFVCFAIATRKSFPQVKYGKRGPFILTFYLVFALLVSIFTVALSPSLSGSVVLAWVIGLLSPLLSLFLLFIPFMMLSGLQYANAGTLVMIFIASIFLIVLALIPVPALIWLKRWIDKEPVPAGVAESVPDGDAGKKPGT